ncbi:MAG TPA: class I SAM-dependent methyltransferase [Cyclobacteriaceae bacterium]|jgi:ubiquinone/menaquinone biosynthesis C-methylase UbiE|nr:class I SAM-dependent methyltransferase [Cyclobacteriaceae bacterium]
MSKDLFSRQANQYATFRPTYPKELYDFIFSYVTSFTTAWDVGTGNGQVARDLSKRFEKVIGSDISAKQLDNAYQAENIFYFQTGETILFSGRRFDLICVAQAIHWFDREKFYSEVKRVGKPNSIIAVWGYGLLSVNSEIDILVKDFYVNIIGPYWDSARKLVDEEYKTISFPFSEIQTPQFAFSFYWTLAEFQGYLNTWSSVQKYIEENNSNPVEDLITKIQPLWGLEKMEIKFPLFLRLGKVV